MPNDRFNMSLAEVAAELGVSRARVQQIEARALEKLAVALAEQGISAEDVLEEGGSDEDNTTLLGGKLFKSKSYL